MMHTHILGPNFQETKSFVLVFEFNYLLIYLWLDICFLYYIGILAFIFNILWYKQFYVTSTHKTQEQIQGVSGTTHA